MLVEKGVGTDGTTDVMYMGESQISILTRLRNGLYSIEELCGHALTDLQVTAGKMN